MRVTKAPGARALAESWMGAAFDPVAAAAHLQSLGLASSASIKGKSIDWTGYRDPDEFSMPPVLTTKTYTDRTCDAFPAALDAIEAMSLGKINIQDYGTPDKVDPAISHAPYLSVTVFSVNAGSTAEIKFTGRAGIAAKLMDEVDKVIAACEPT